MKLFSRLTLHQKLILFAFIFTLAPMAVVGYLNLRSAHEELEQLNRSQLDYLCKDRKAQLRGYFDGLRLSMEVLSGHRLLKDLFVEYMKAYEVGGAASEGFKAIDGRYHARLAEIKDRYGFEDMLFVRLDGEVVVSVNRGREWTTNLMNGPYSTSMMSKCFSRALGGMNLTDFEMCAYTGTPRAFIGAPMVSNVRRPGFDEGEM
ncbi:MAG: hypothetical protein ACLGPL_09675, partial [Acidobacteriota bacterium]